MNDQHLPVGRLDCEQAELLPAREALQNITINTIVGVNIALAIDIGGLANANAGQLLGVG